MRAVVFDFDGVILDTESHEYRSFQELYHAHGVELPAERWQEVIGSSDSTFDPYAHLEELVGRKLDFSALMDERRRSHLEGIARERELPGVVSVLDQARRLGWGVGLASSSNREWVEGHLTNLGLLDRFDVIRTREEVERSKPDPALYRLAVEGLGVEPGEAVALEDSPNGALAAKRAGLKCIIVPHAVTAGMAFCEVDDRLHSLEELDLEAFAARVAGATAADRP
ncbi:HAD family hydrolase [Desmospora profundinema]|uniref:HAD superfamily hydrolase (TIGR01509 family) n=1 Tax=Desmospora profundinema TaxID=1571184 RepID=A0ABU1IN75_9BACL|nr:HAD family hydrolase [Desmospora profundinema]MDR6226146.1 HAD superfamily hydrolase (TIGR01509 family) [Desmospora profundinema]